MQKGQIHYLGNDFTLVFPFSGFTLEIIFALSICTYCNLSLFSFMKLTSAVEKRKSWTEYRDVVMALNSLFTKK